MRNNPVSTTIDGYGIYADDIDGNSKASTLSLVRVFISDYQTFGVYVAGKVKVNVLESRIDALNGSGTPRGTGISLYGNSAGVPTGKISRSVVEGNNGDAIYLEEASKISITGNTLENSISIRSQCSFPGGVASGNKISGNTIHRVTTSRAIYVYASISGPTICNPAANTTLISKNLILAFTRPSGNAVYLFASDPSGGFTAQLNATKITGNRIYGFSGVSVNIDSASPPVLSGNVLLR